jgi:hypothetical protein
VPGGAGARQPATNAATNRRTKNRIRDILHLVGNRTADAAHGILGDCRQPFSFSQAKISST